MSGKQQEVTPLESASIAFLNIGVRNMRGNTDAYGHEESSEFDRRAAGWDAFKEKGVGRTVTGEIRMDTEFLDLVGKHVALRAQLMDVEERLMLRMQGSVTARVDGKVYHVSRNYGASRGELRVCIQEATIVG